MAKDRLSVEWISYQNEGQDWQSSHSFKGESSQNDLKRWQKGSISLSQSSENSRFLHIKLHLRAREIWLCYTYPDKNKEKDIMRHHLRTGRRGRKSRGVNTINYKGCKKQSSFYPWNHRRISSQYQNLLLKFRFWFCKLPTERQSAK